jgi:hypothetical protein
LGITPEKAAVRWRNRFLDGGLAVLQKDAPRPGQPHTVSTVKVQNRAQDDAGEADCGYSLEYAHDGLGSRREYRYGSPDPAGKWDSYA